MYRTEQMVQLSWERAKPGIPGFLRCLLTSSMPSNAKVVSVKPLGFPQVGTFTGAYRTIFEVTAAGTKVPMIIDIEFFGSGRTLFSLIQFAPYASADAVKAGETRLARSMTVRAGGFAA
jgi:hypothetical protein